MRVRKSVHTLLLRVGKHHPQAPDLYLPHISPCLPYLRRRPIDALTRTLTLTLSLTLTNPDPTPNPNPDPNPDPNPKPKPKPNPNPDPIPNPNPDPDPDPDPSCPQALIYPLAVASHEARSANALGEAQGL